MLDEKDSINLDLVVVQGLREQLMMQKATILYLVHPGQLSVSNQMAVEENYLDGLAKDLIAEIDALSLTEVNLI